jgi:hypothetical protein
MTKSQLIETCEEYKTLKHRIQALEKQAQERKAILEEEVIKSGDNEIIAGAFKIALIEQTRESFDLKAAKPVLGDELNPFLKLTTFTQLRVS